MASGSRTTTLRQLGAGASNRFTEGLLASGGKLALVGLVASVLTLGYTIWFRAELSHQAKVAAPMALDAVRLNAALNQSFSAVRSWRSVWALLAEILRSAAGSDWPPRLTRPRHFDRDVITLVQLQYSRS